MDVSAAVMPKIIDPKLSHCQTSTTENNSFELNIEFETAKIFHDVIYS